MANTLKIATTLIIIFGLLSYTKFFGKIISPIIILQPEPCETAFIGPFTDFLIGNEDVIANFVLVVLFFILLIFQIRYAYFRKTTIDRSLSNTYTKGSHSKFSIMINVIFRANWLKSAEMHIDYIRIPLPNVPVECVDVRVINLANFWVVQDKNFKLANKVKLFGINDKFEKIWEKEKGIKIPIENIKPVKGNLSFVNQNEISDLAIVGISIRESTNKPQSAKPSTSKGPVSFSDESFV